SENIRRKEAGGGRGIRTPGTVTRTTVFETAPFNHSGIPPRKNSGRLEVAYLAAHHSRHKAAARLMPGVWKSCAGKLFNIPSRALPRSAPLQLGTRPKVADLPQDRLFHFFILR